MEALSVSFQILFHCNTSYVDFEVLVMEKLLTLVIKM